MISRDTTGNMTAAGKKIPVAVANFKDKNALFYKTVGKTGTDLYVVSSKTGTSFTQARKKATVAYPDGRIEAIDSCHFFRISTLQDKTYVMVYVRETNKDRKTIIATSEDFIQWTVRGEMKGTSGEIAVVVPHIEEEGNTMCYYGDRILSVAFSKDLINWGNAKKLVSSRGGHFDHSPLSPLGISVIKEGILVIYDT